MHDLRNACKMDENGSVMACGSATNAYKNAKKCMGSATNARASAMATMNEASIDAMLHAAALRHVR